VTNISRLGQEFGQYLIQLTAELFLGKGEPRSLSEMERNIRAMLLKAGLVRIAREQHPNSDSAVSSL
jgi:hypothetical protein